MHFKTWICTAILSMIFSTSVFASTSSVQMVRASQYSGEELMIELTGTKVITDDFSFKFPSGWDIPCVMIHNDNSYEIYEKSSFEDDGDGLLFSIDFYEDADIDDLSGCSILSFCGNRTYVLVSYYEDYLEDTLSELYKSCAAFAKQMRKSFVSYVRD